MDIYDFDFLLLLSYPILLFPKIEYYLDIELKS